MTPEAVMEAFLQRLQADPNLAPLAAVVMPYRAALGPAIDQVAALDRLADSYIQARGGLQFVNRDRGPIELDGVTVTFHRLEA
jgi:hypothetical protein